MIVLSRILILYPPDHLVLDDDRAPVPDAPALGSLAVLVHQVHGGPGPEGQIKDGDGVVEALVGNVNGVLTARL